MAILANLLQSSEQTLKEMKIARFLKSEDLDAHENDDFG